MNDTSIIKSHSYFSGCRKFHKPISVLLLILFPIHFSLATPSTTVSSTPSVNTEMTQVSPPSTQSQGTPENFQTEVKLKVKKAVEELQKLSPQLTLTQRANSLSPNLILRMDIPLEGIGGTAQAQSFINRFKGLWTGLDIEISDFRTRRFKTYIRLKASIDGHPVFNQDARLFIDQQGHIKQLSSAFSAIYQVQQARLAEHEAVRIALTHLQLPLDAPHLTQLGYVIHAGIATAVYEVQAGGQPAQSHPVALVDAIDGVILSVSDRVRK